jgi:hypothetical protein
MGDVRTTIDFSVRGAFILRPEAVRRVWSVLEAGFGSVSATARCADNARREFANLSLLLDFDNASGKQIRSLEFAASRMPSRSNSSPRPAGRRRW